MSDEQHGKNDTAQTQDAQHFVFPTTEYDLLDLLDRLESLVEDMDDLGITARDEAEERIAILHKRLDEC